MLISSSQLEHFPQTLFELSVANELELDSQMAFKEEPCFLQSFPIFTGWIGWMYRVVRP